MRILARRRPDRHQNSFADLAMHRSCPRLAHVFAGPRTNVALHLSYSFYPPTDSVNRTYARYAIA